MTEISSCVQTVQLAC